MRVLIGLLLVVCLGALADPKPTNIDALRQFTLTNPVGTFIQKKHIKVLSQPFISKGEYHFEPANGLTWTTIEPVQNQLMINAKGISEIQHDGSSKLMTSDNAISAMMLTLFMGNDQQLSKEFVVEKRLGCLALIPINTQIKLMIDLITFCPADDQAVLSIIEVGGNKTEIQLLPIPLIIPPPNP
ncbi:outer-membrane lipoprotein carrier protein LolA [Alteromonadaceae bacterium BrNp21-10]|nr:outer-membrane lipoprotein carrier protein LolA [Alteromonadaceae bacterium BrNp21-10]